MNCPLCKSETVVVKSLSRDLLRHSIISYFNDPSLPNEAIEIGYDLNKCSACHFEFANPAVPGNDQFYNWITKQPKYYPAFRWEYGIVYSIISSENKKVTVMDVGCGSGDFLQKCLGNHHITAKGLDTTASSVEECKRKGLDVTCTYLENVVSEYPDYFDTVTSFHVLEHVANPFQILLEIKKILKPGGCVFLSTPYSPMSFESDWFDPLNNPPHHMGRWNERSYKKISELLNMEIEFFYPEKISTLKRAYYAFRLSKNIKGGAFDVFKAVINESRLFLNIYLNQTKREKLSNGQIAPDLILVKLIKAHK